MCLSQHVCFTACMCVTASVCHSMCVTACMCACVWNSEGNLLDSVLPFNKEIQELNSSYNTCMGIFLLVKPLMPFLPFKENLDPAE